MEHPLSNLRFKGQTDRQTDRQSDAVFRFVFLLLPGRASGLGEGDACPGADEDVDVRRLGVAGRVRRQGSSGDAPTCPSPARSAEESRHPPRRARREGSEPPPRSMNARRLRSATRAKEHAARRHSRCLRLQQLLHRHLWRVRGWQWMQTVWMEWGRSAALPLLPPAPPQTRPLQIVDRGAFPALPLALTKASAGP